MLRCCVLLVVACDAGSPPKSPAPELPPTPVVKAQVAAVPDPWAVPPPPATHHKHGVRRVDLVKADLGKLELPKHGIVFKSWGLGGDGTFVLDSDANTSRMISNLMGKPPTDRRRTLSPAVVKMAMTTAFTAWDEEPTGPMPSATDVREDLYILDGDEAFYLSGYPIAIGGESGRPRAAALLEVLDKLAPES